MQPAARHEVPRAHRLFALAFIGAFLVFGFSGAEQWPFTSWHLFSALRTQRVEIWRATTVDHAGNEAAMPFGAFGVRYAGWYTRLKAFPRLSPERQIATCSTWAAEVERHARGVAIDEVRVYRGTIDHGKRVGDRAAPPALHLAYRCANGTVEARA